MNESLKSFLRDALFPQPHQRQGQAFMNILWDRNNFLYRKLIQNDIDPYYSEDKLYSAIQFVVDHWNDYIEFAEVS